VTDKIPSEPVKGQSSNPVSFEISNIKGQLQECSSNSTLLSATQDLSLHSTSFHCKKIMCCQVESTYLSG